MYALNAASVVVSKAIVLELCRKATGPPVTSGTMKLRSMSTMFEDISPVPLSPDKPTNRGRFSDDRDYWEQVHKRRYLQWQGGDGIEEIAASEGVTYNAVKHSLLWCEARLPRGDVLAAHQTRLRLQAFARLSTRYLDELETLMSDPNPVVRVRALEAFRRTVGLEGGGVQVNVNQQTAVLQNGQVRSFEEAMERVRERLVAEQRETQSVDLISVTDSNEDPE